MKKKILCFALLALSIFSFTACKTQKINLCDHLIEERYNLFTAEDDTYCATYSSGMREKDYALDGVKNEMVDFGVITFSRIDRQKIKADNCNYIITIDDEVLQGQLTKFEDDNTFSVDIGKKANQDSSVSIQLNFADITFDKTMKNTTGEFSVDKDAALSIAGNELDEQIQNFQKNKNDFEVLMKIVRDYSSETNYYWYVGVVGKDGSTLGILIDANSGDVIAKKV